MKKQDCRALNFLSGRQSCLFSCGCLFGTSIADDSEFTEE